MHVLRGLGLEDRLRADTFYPRSWNNRDWKTGEVMFDILFGPDAEQAYGAPYLLAHRGDLHAALASAVPPEHVKLDHRPDRHRPDGRGVRLAFANGAVAEADAAIGADGCALEREDGTVRRGRAQLHRPHRLSHGVPRPIGCAASRSTTAPSGGARTATS
jgi:hypothetical protein